MADAGPREVVNFGGNVRFTAQHYFQPRDEAELLQILRDHHGAKIRVVASRHAWSPLIECTEVLIDLVYLDRVMVERRGGEAWARVGGGCPMNRVLVELDREGLTTPSIGLIAEQRIAGAISTGTHGSGKHSLSHYIESLRIACFAEDSRTPVIREITGGDELRAARCGLGCLGVIVEVTFRCVPQYFVQEHAKRCSSLSEVMANESDWPLQQFFLIPHAWHWYAQQRRVDPRGRPSGGAWLYRWYWWLTFDIGLHLLILLAAATLRSRWAVHGLYRWLLPVAVRASWQVTDRSFRQLTMDHERFRHLEMELFVAADRLEGALEFLREVLQLADDGEFRVSAEVGAMLESCGQAEVARSLAGSYVHHYPICIRRVLADDTLLSMAAGRDRTWYAVSLITYVIPREPFYGVAGLLAESMADLFEARIHWGKWFPWGAERVRRAYPDLGRFERVRRQLDPAGAFVNPWVSARLGVAGPGPGESVRSDAARR
ncbi:MAG: D-arabinono-1,4-lactone oxidase [Pirellulales bacterium]